jgi:hypothetical protein
MTSELVKKIREDLEHRRNIFCEDRSYILDCLVAQDPDHFLKGDWYDMFPLSSVEVGEDDEVKVELYVEAIEASLICVVGKLTKKGDDVFCEYKFEPFKMNTLVLKAKCLSSDRDFIAESNVEEGLNIKRNTKSSIIKAMRSVCNSLGDIHEAQEFHQRNMFDGDDVIGCR